MLSTSQLAGVVSKMDFRFATLTEEDILAAHEAAFPDVVSLRDPPLKIDSKT